MQSNTSVQEIESFWENDSFISKNHSFCVKGIKFSTKAPLSFQVNGVQTERGEISQKVGPAALTLGSIAHLPGPLGKLVIISRIHDPGDHNGMMLKMLVETNTDSLTVPINQRQADTKNHKAHFYICVVLLCQSLSCVLLF